MHKPVRLIFSLGVSAALALSLSACSSDPEENETKACDAYAAYVGAVTEARVSLSSSSSVGEIREARDNVADKYEDLQSALDDVEQDRINALETSWNSYTDAVDDVDSDLTVPQAADELAPAVDQLEQAQADLGASLDCS